MPVASLACRREEAQLQASAGHLSWVHRKNDIILLYQKKEEEEREDASAITANVMGHIKKILHLSKRRICQTHQLESQSEAVQH